MALRRGEEGSLSPFWRSVCVVLIFLLLWPPIWGLVAWWMKFDFGTPLVGWVVTIAIYSYVICVPSALLAGAIHVVAAIAFRYNSILVALLAAGGAAMVILIPMVVITPGPFFRVQHPLHAPTDSYVIDIVASLVASTICWRLTRRFARAA